MAALPRTKSRPRPSGLAGAWRQYAEDVRRPLYCLLFLFPLVATYEFGALLLRPTTWPGRDLVAHSLIQRLLAWFGATGFWLPAVALLLILLLWHILQRDPWRVHSWMLPLMALESVLLTLPLFVLGQVMRHAALTALSTLDVRQHVVLALGAGIYEELVFRFGVMLGLTHLLEGVLRTPVRVSRPFVIIASALLFAACHFAPIGSEPPSMQFFLLFMVAGIYLGGVFLARGLGIAVGTHAAFNLITLAYSQLPAAG